jgi:hypothetical protein
MAGALNMMYSPGHEEPPAEEEKKGPFNPIWKKVNTKPPKKVFYLADYRKEPGSLQTID